MRKIFTNQMILRVTQNIQKVFRTEGYVNGLIGLSGGVDSATSCALATRALGKNHVYPVLLPYGSLNDRGMQNARTVIQWLNIPQDHVKVIDVKSMVDAAVKGLDASMDDGRKGNIMARMRMVVLFDLAKAMPAFVIGTENKTEHHLGYYTRFGDEASDVEPLRNFYKSDVYELARSIGVPRDILLAPPTAGLWEGQTDEGEFGFTYKVADEILSLVVDKHLSKEKILKKGYNVKLVTRIWRWIEKGNFKGRLPYTMK
jgi:NAD+ synthase